MTDTTAGVDAAATTEAEVTGGRMDTNCDTFTQPTRDHRADPPGNFLHCHITPDKEFSPTRKDFKLDKFTWSLKNYGWEFDLDLIDCFRPRHKLITVKYNIASF